MNYLFHLLVYFEIYVIVAMSLNLLIGYSGLLQVAHAAYFGVGAYAAASSRHWLVQRSRQGRSVSWCRCLPCAFAETIS
jgi:ABC-type branched-subunit amino acid transport system permease subunit